MSWWWSHRFTDNTIAIKKPARGWKRSNGPAISRHATKPWNLSGDWVLVLDADEQLVDSVKPALQALMAQPDVLVINLRYEDGLAVALLQRQPPVPQAPGHPMEPGLSLDDRRLR